MQEIQENAGVIPGQEDPPGARKRQLTAVSLLGKSHGQRSLAGYSPWGHKESDTTEHLSTHTVSSAERYVEYTVFCTLTVFLEFPSSSLYTMPLHSFQ